MPSGIEAVLFPRFAAIVGSPPGLLCKPCGDTDDLNNGMSLLDNLRSPLE